MWRDVEHMVFSREDRRRFRDKTRRCLDALAQMLRESQFDFDRPLTGMEIELNLVDRRGEPANRNEQVLALVADRDSTNHGCWSEEWLGIQSSSTRSPRSWAAATRASTSASVPKTGSTSQ